MKRFILKHKNAIIALFCIIAVLVAAFLIGNHRKNDTVLTNSSENYQSSAVTLSDTAQISKNADSVTAEQSNNNKTTEKTAEIISEQSSTAAKEDKGTAKTSKSSQTTTQTSKKSSAKTAAQTTVKPEFEKSCRLSINCKTAIDSGLLSKAVLSTLPSDGVILAPTEFEINSGDTAFDVILRACKQYNIQFEYQKTTVYNSSYIEGIANVYEFDCGRGSGWMYKVNGEFMSYSTSGYNVQNGDVIELIYSSKIGADIGQSYGD